MAKSSNALTGCFTLLLAFIMITSATKSALSARKHIYVEGEIINLETRRGSKRATYQSFGIKNPKYKGKVFDNHPLFRMSKSGTRIMDYFKEKETIGFHVEKENWDDLKINIYSLQAKGKTIVPLARKWRFKYWNLAIGIFLLVGSFFIFKNG